ncbi:hypothetical protein [Nocardioides sp.]|uniref:hypothetical protein n=1 Tax=Nocardioides sp. TaxID=35761 RepID=UPI003D0E993E
MNGGGEQAGADGPEPVGSVAEEAAKLFGALSGWAREHGDGLADVVGHGFAEAVGDLADAATDVNEHLATGSQECTYCPVCRGVHLIRSTSPEVKAHLGAAASSLLHALSALMAPPSESSRDARPTPVQHIDLDETGWTDESGDDS